MTEALQETDEQLFAKARAHMEKYSIAASLDRRLWDATVRIALRSAAPSREAVAPWDKIVGWYRCGSHGDRYSWGPKKPEGDSRSAESGGWAPVYASPQPSIEPVAWRCRTLLPSGTWQEWKVSSYKPQGPQSESFEIEPLYASPQPSRSDGRSN